LQNDSSPHPAKIGYLDFELEIGPGSGREYPVVVIRSPAGEARETRRFPFDEIALESRLDKLQIALLKSLARKRMGVRLSPPSWAGYSSPIFNLQVDCRDWRLVSEI
jgi:hypothetical protein